MSATALQFDTEVTINPVDAIWSIIQSQTKAVQAAIAQRFEERKRKEMLAKKIKEYEANLSPEVITKAHEIADSIKQAYNDVAECEAKGISLSECGKGTSHEDFMKELEEEGFL